MAGQGLFQRLQLNDDAADAAVADEDVGPPPRTVTTKSSRRAARMAKDISLTDSGSTNTSAGPPTAKVVCSLIGSFSRIRPVGMDLLNSETKVVSAYLLIKDAHSFCHCILNNLKYFPGHSLPFVVMGQIFYSRFIPFH